MKYYITETGKELLSEWDPRGDRPITEPSRTLSVRNTQAKIAGEEQARMARQGELAGAKGAKSGVEARRMRKRAVSMGTPKTRAAQHASAEAGSAKAVRRAMSRIGKPTDQSQSASSDDLRGAVQHGGPSPWFPRANKLRGPARAAHPNPDRRGRLPK